MSSKKLTNYIKKMKPIKQSVINTFNRCGIPYEELLKDDRKVVAENRFSGGSCETTPLIKCLIEWVYATSNQYEIGDYRTKVSDFDRVRYFILDQDANAYSICID